MPIYEYECKFCLNRFQLLQKFSDPPPEVCPHCGKKGGIKKLISPTSFELKGSGWYATDYKSSSNSNTTTSVSSKSQTKEAKSG